MYVLYMNAYKDTTHTWPYCMQCSPKYFLQAPAVGLHDLAELLESLKPGHLSFYTGCPDDFPWDL